MTETLTSPIFAGLNRRERAIAQSIATAVTVDDGRDLAVQGHVGRQFGVVLSGELRVVRDGEEIARLREGDCFGEMSLLRGPLSRQTASVESVGTSEVLVMSRQEFDVFAASLPEAAARVRAIAATRESNLQD